MNDVKNRIYFERIAKGDEIAFNQVYELYREKFYLVAFKLTHSSTYAEDIIQEVFISLWNKKNIVAKADNPEAYLFKILQNIVFEYLKKTIKEYKDTSVLSNITGQDVEEAIFKKENFNLLRVVINKLPERQKEIFELIKLEGRSRNEVAELLNISPNTVKNHLSAALDFIKNNMQQATMLTLIILFNKNL